MGKIHIAKLAVLYALSKGLKIISSSILGVHASFFSGTHLNSILCWKPQKHKSMPFRSAFSALERIQRKPLLRHILLALDVLFIDDIGILSNQHLAILDIMYCKHCNSPLPYGGVLILGSLDLHQISIIKAYVHYNLDLFSSS